MNRHYEREHPGDLLHVDVKKLGRVPDGGGWWVHGRCEEVRGRGNGWDYVHVAIDDHPAGLRRGAARRAHRHLRRLPGAGRGLVRRRGVTVRRVLTDNAKSYRVGKAWIVGCAQLGIGRRFTKPAHPWTNGKAERFNRTLQTEWAYATPWSSNNQRTAALDSWLAHYNTARSHSALGGRPPISRLPA